MAQSASLNTNQKLLALIALTVGANYLAGQYWGYPFLHCWLSPVLSYLYAAWGIIALYILIMGTIWCLLTRQMMRALIGAAILVAVIELPEIARMVFAAGGSCG